MKKIILTIVAFVLMGTVVTAAGQTTPFLDIMTTNMRVVVDAINEVFEILDELAADVGGNRIAIDELRLPHEFYIIEHPVSLGPGEETILRTSCSNTGDTTKSLSYEQRGGDFGDILIKQQAMSGLNFLIEAKNNSAERIIFVPITQCFKGDFIQVAP